MKRNRNYEDRPFFLISTTPAIEKGCRRWNLALIAVLVFVVVTVFVITMAPELAATSKGAHAPVVVQPETM